ncbi:MAG: hypothetical protein V4642_07025 [Bacteroidota bacterium]
MKNLFKKNSLLKIFLCVVIAGTSFSCTDDSPVEPQKESENVIYYFTGFKNPVTNEYEAHFCKMNEDGSNRVSITQLSSVANEAQYSSNMKRLIIGGYSVMDIDGKNKTYLIGGHAEQSYQEISPNGDRFFQMYHGRCDIFDAVDNWKKREIFREGYASGAKWSYDSRRIIYYNLGNIISRNADSSDDRVVIYQYDTTQMTGYAGNVYPSPYEDKIFFERQAVGKNIRELCVMNGDGSDLRVIHVYSIENGFRGFADWAPDGKSVIFEKSIDKYFTSIMLLKLDGSATTLPPKRYINRSSRFSHNGTKILYQLYIPDASGSNKGRFVLQLSDLYGTNEKILTPEGYDDASPGWASR